MFSLRVKYNLLTVISRSGNKYNQIKCFSNGRFENHNKLNKIKYKMCAMHSHSGYPSSVSFVIETQKILIFVDDESITDIYIYSDGDKHKDISKNVCQCHRF